MIETEDPKPVEIDLDRAYTVWEGGLAKWLK